MWYVTAWIALPLNRTRVTGVPRGMRDFAKETSRGLAAAGVLLSAVVHLDLWEQGFRDIRTIGPLFLLNVVAGLDIGVVLLVWRCWVPAEVADYAAAFFGLLAAALLWQAMRERIS